MSDTAHDGLERRRAPREGPGRALLNALYRVIRWIAAHVRGFYAAIGVFLGLGLLAAAAALGGFILLAWGVAGGVTTAIDESVVRWMVRLRNPLLDALAMVGAVIGSGAAAWAALALGTAALWLTRHRSSVVLLWIAVTGGHVLSRLLKSSFERPRPAGEDLQLLGRTFQFPTSPSFPSGHALTSMVVFGTAAYLIARIEPTVRLRRLTLFTAAGLILMVGLSRIYLGVHYPSDVVAGYLAGFVWATSCALAIEAVRYLRARNTRVADAERDLEQGVRPLLEVAGQDRRS